MKNLLLLIIILCLLFSCSFLKKGKVISKKYEPLRTWNTTEIRNILVGKTIIPQTITITHFDDEDYIILVEGWTQKEKFIPKQEWYVDKYFFESVSIGDYVEFDKTTMSYID